MDNLTPDQMLTVMVNLMLHRASIAAQVGYVARTLNTLDPAWTYERMADEINTRMRAIADDPERALSVSKTSLHRWGHRPEGEQ